MTQICLFLVSLMAFSDSAVADQGRKGLTFPDIEVQNQDGKRLSFYRDLIQDKTVALQFIFTSCPKMCPTMGANFAALQKQLAEAGHSEITLISVSINPSEDTPQRLHDWRARFGGTSGWELVTAPQQDIDQIQKLLQVYAADISAHTPFAIIGNERSGYQFLDGLTAPETLAKQLVELTKAEPAAPEDKPRTQTIHYFPDTLLSDQNGEKHKLYSELMADKIVIINTFFSSCQGVCPVTMGTLKKIADDLGERLGQDVRILSLTVDPDTDTPEVLKAYGQQLGVGKGWYLLTASKEDLDLTLKKFGQYTEFREGHSNIFILGNLPTGLWKKAMALAPYEQVRQVVRSVVDDKGEDGQP